MIRIGLNQKEKQKELNKYLIENDIKKIYCFYFKKYKPAFKTSKEIEYIEYSDIIMYKFFYRLLEEIDKSSLIVMNECMRTQNRSELTYNCAHHYLNQTPHHIIFEFFPIIDNKDNFMILLDMENPTRFKGTSFDYTLLQTNDIKIKPFRIKYKTNFLKASESEVEEYEKLKKELFDNLGQKDPDTIPRTLQLFAGVAKKVIINNNNLYVARNKRFKMENVVTYKDIITQGNYIVLDMHYRRLNFNDFLKTSNNKRLEYVCTSLPIDSVMSDEFTKWNARLGAFYAKASLYK